MCGGVEFGGVDMPECDESGDAPGCMLAPGSSGGVRYAGYVCAGYACAKGGLAKTRSSVADARCTRARAPA